MSLVSVSDGLCLTVIFKLLDKVQAGALTEALL
jgi:hypothetical protein